MYTSLAVRSPVFEQLAFVLRNGSSDEALAGPVLHIVGGKAVDIPGTWPHQASLEIKSSGSHSCGAVLISSRWLVTAAHCLGSSASKYQIVLGQHDRETRREGNPIVYAVESVTRHPSFSNNGFSGFPNDVGVVRLAQDVVLDQFTQPIRMADSDAPDFTGQDCYITGWGRLYGYGPLPNVLQEANIDVLTQTQCRRFWGNKILGYHICVTDKQTSSRGACNGDSGGPLVCIHKSSGDFVLAGVTSWGSGTCTTRSPSVYARISYFRGWIRTTTGV
ncbi:hypothetical protein CAPTEDRAFT_226412 [Capitella teleta]|uniref:Peptidase S1 domain-containing protein n=1 Tax=Capitella teleta TaxID=283909 RepID=R7TK33_CAPTE|nr:hypothetical protein CAPTEDRAFT_226412 [Capitella teleta]|eukprot:ELT91475.1 hypothetical protein CAPTEDRAFT_226412 [Capitella teleta]